MHTTLSVGRSHWRNPGLGESEASAIFQGATAQGADVDVDPFCAKAHGADVDVDPFCAKENQLESRLQAPLA